MMLPDCRLRLENALSELVVAVVRAPPPFLPLPQAPPSSSTKSPALNLLQGEIGEGLDPEECKELKDAKEAVAAAQAVFA